MRSIRHRRLWRGAILFVAALALAPLLLHTHAHAAAAPCAVCAVKHQIAAPSPSPSLGLGPVLSGTLVAPPPAAAPLWRERAVEVGRAPPPVAVGLS
jgi:hypothetical protein